MKNLLHSFDSFIEKVRNEIKEDLPGSNAHLKMASYNRVKLMQKLKIPSDAKQSAVLILFHLKKGEVYTTLMKRAVYKGTHSGQISFPGGKKDPTDKNLEETALRETEEEIGINTDSISVLGYISELYIPPSNFLVRPYLGFTNSKIIYKPDPREVDTLIEMPLSIIFNEDIVEEGMVPVNDGSIKIKAPYFKVKNHVIWGATAMILSELKEIIRKIEH